MHDFLTAVVLGIVQGVTEFLPISSTGHLILVNQWFGFNGAFEKMFDVVIQFGSILAVVIYFWKRLWPFGSHKPLDAKLLIWQTWFKAVVAVVPALLIGALFGKKIQEVLYTPTVVAGALLFWGIVLIIVEKKNKQGTVTTISHLTYMTALLIGVIQCLAYVPGTSRSAMTIIGAMMLGCSRVVAAEFSFFLAIPTMTAASAYAFMKYSSAMTPLQYGVLAAGFITAFFVAWGVIAVFMKFIQKNNFIPFGVYRIILGAGVLLYFLLNK